MLEGRISERYTFCANKKVENNKIKRYDKQNIRKSDS